MLNVNSLSDMRLDNRFQDVEAEEELHELARYHALAAAREGFSNSGRGAAVVSWPPREALNVSFFAWAGCMPLGDEVAGRVALYDPQSEFVMVYLYQDGSIEAYTYRIPEARPAWNSRTVH